MRAAERQEKRRSKEKVAEILEEKEESSQTRHQGETAATCSEVSLAPCSLLLSGVVVVGIMALKGKGCRFSQ